MLAPHLDTLYLISSVVGGLVFLVRTIMQFVGATDDWELDLDDGDSDASFRLLSIQGLTAFFMMFGLSGLAAIRQSPLSALTTLAVAIVAGLAAFWLLAKLFGLLLRLQSSGTIDMDNALDQEGTVYLTIPGEGTGQVQVVVQNHLKVFDARSTTGEEIKTGETVRVTEILAGNVLVVSKVDI